ncbi:MAG: TIGR01841 family phasin [Hyphomonadaceae bacterium JAD_PAG50586_4]|nr:MAG: TIGR01841 family phasin [Hyphomonadaceae bacterium JAD_PAG50586_4]
MASAAAAQKGFETISARTVAFQKEAMEKHVAAAKSLMTSKSVQEFVEKQNDYAKTSFEAYVAELTSVSGLVQGVAKDAIAPINDRVNAAAQLIQAGAAR